MKKKKQGRYVSEITIHTEHFLANLLALRKILGFTLADAKKVINSSSGSSLTLEELIEVNSELTTDEIHTELEEYQIQVTIINQ